MNRAGRTSLLDPDARRRQRGSITILVTFLLPTLVVMCLLAVNVGRLIHDKLRLQHTADLAAYSAATVQAAGLNEIADLNFMAEMELMALRIYLAMPVMFQSQDEGNKCVKYFKKVFKAIRKDQDDANKWYAKKAKETAESVVKQNLGREGVKDAKIKSINPRSSGSGDEKLMEYREHMGTMINFLYKSGDCGIIPCMLVVKKWDDAMAGDEKHYGPHMGLTFSVENSIPAPYMEWIKYKIVKKKTPITYAAFELTQPQRTVLLGEEVFGRMPKLRAYSAAMPTGGEVENGMPYYRPIMVRLAKLNPKPNVSDLSKVLH
jgi:hypothetical protein